MQEFEDNYDGHPNYGEDFFQGNYEDQDDDDELEGQDEGEDNKQRSKRRSKNDNVGRTYTCGCGKSYLSYPALYTHIKQKHNGRPPEGTNNAQLHTGRGRGRPRKEKPENHGGEMIKIDQFEQQNLQESQMKSQLSKELTTEMLD